MEILYSTTILSFLRKVKKMAFEILSGEMGIETRCSRIHYKGYLYPLNFVVFDHPSKLGTFHFDLLEIGVNKLYLQENDEKIKEVIRHELAHLITYLEHGPNVAHHGKEFRSICKRYRWSESVSRATASLEKSSKNSRIADKVRKLFSLAQSPNPKEAKEATLKAQMLLDKYNLEYTPEEEETALLRVLERKRGSAKLQAIASILRSFYVYPVFNKGQNGMYLEIIGDKISVEIAEYTAHYLDTQFEILWKQAQKEDSNLKGQASKNSFFRGLSEGYQARCVPSKALVRTENQLIELSRKIYPHLSVSSSKHRSDGRGIRKGREKGMGLKIREGIQEKMKRFLLATNQPKD